MKPHLPLLLSVVCLYSVGYAESVTVSTWDQISQAIQDGKQDIFLSGKVQAGTTTITPGSDTIITGNGEENSLLVAPAGEGQATNPLFIVGANQSLTWKNIFVTGTVASPDKFNNAAQLILVNSSSGNANLLIENSVISGVKVGSDNYVPSLINLYEGNGYNKTSNYSLRDSSFSDNEARVATIFSSNFKSGSIDNCHFTRNGSNNLSQGGALMLRASYSSSLIIKNSTFTGNYVGAGNSEQALGGAIYATDHLNVSDSIFRDNYAMKGDVSDGMGGAIYLQPADNNRGVQLTISALTSNSEFSGNRMGATGVDKNGKPIGGVANAVYVDFGTNGQGGSSSSFFIGANEGKSVTFFDPVVVKKETIQPSAPAGLIKFNGKNVSESPICAGSVVFSGQNYTSDADRMSRIRGDFIMGQADGTVVITKGACLGADMQSGTIDAAKSAVIRNYGYSLAKGTLKITDEGSLIAGGFMVGTNSGQSNEGWSNCVLSVGRSTNLLTNGNVTTGASLTTGWVNISQGVSFDLLSFYQGGQTGISIELAKEGNYWGSSFFRPSNDPTFEKFGQAATGRFVLGGTLGLADSLDMYRDIMWQTNQEFLLMKLGESAATEYANGNSGFDQEILSNTTKSSKVENASVYNGEWGQEWRDSNNDGKVDELYAVWKATGNTPSIPEPSTATMSLLALTLLSFRRRR